MTSDCFGEERLWGVMVEAQERGLVRETSTLIQMSNNGDQTRVKTKEGKKWTDSG